MTPPPYTPRITVDGQQYFPEPYSLVPLPHDLQIGLIPVGVLAVISVGATLAVITFICYRLMTWRLHYDSFLGYNQYVLLVLNLLVADLQQSSSFLFSFHWVRFKRILAPSTPCFAQAWLLHSGDVSSGFFVLAIALHTFVTAVYGIRIGHKPFAAVVFSIWALAYTLTGIGVGLHGKKYFVRAGAWCWVSEAYESDRLALHYVWVFLVQFGTVLIYVVTFFMLRQKTNQLFEKSRQGHNVNTTTILAVNRITKLMTLYPCVYVLLTLPLSAGRMWSYAHGGEPYSDTYACISGSLITSCGWVDSLLYTMTRRRLLNDTMPERDVCHLGILHSRTITVDASPPLDDSDPKMHSFFGDVDDYGNKPSRSPNWSAAHTFGSRPSNSRTAFGLRALVEDDRLEYNSLEEERQKRERKVPAAELPASTPVGWIGPEP